MTLLVMEVQVRVQGRPRGPHIVTGLPLEDEFSKEYGEWYGNDPTAGRT